MVDPVWTSWLLVAAGWTAIFSMSTTPGIRGFRNLGWIACYGMGIVMPFALHWRSALATWGAIGVVTGVLYYLYETVGYLRRRSDDTRPSARVLVDGVLLWPLMLPEVVEYALADLKVVKPVVPPVATGSGVTAAPEEQDLA